MARTNRTRYTVLGTLSLRPMTGYDIKKFIQQSIANFWHESYGQIYPTLKQLADDGQVTREVQPQEGKPDRYVYSVTESGRSELREWLVAPAEPQVPRIELLLKLFFGAEISREANLRHIERYREDLRGGLAICEDITRRLKEERADAPGLPFWLLGLRWGALAQEALLQWCDEAEKVLEGL